MHTSPGNDKDDKVRDGNPGKGETHCWLKRPWGGLAQGLRFEHRKDCVVRRKGKETVAAERCGQHRSGKPRDTWETDRTSLGRGSEVSEEREAWEMCPGLPACVL